MTSIQFVRSIVTSIRHSSLRLGVVMTLGAIVLGSFSQARLAAQDDAEALREKTVKKGLEYLRSSQADDGTFSARFGPGLTALAVTAALRNGLGADDPMVSKGLKALQGFVKPDGGIYGGDRLKNYETCIAVMCFAEANENGKYDETLANANKFLKGMQYGANGDKEKSDPWYGGVGYGGPERPDLSNTAYMIDALIATGEDQDSEAIQRALTFITRCQNSKNAENDSIIAEKINDGGFRYVAPQDESAVKEEDIQGGLRSYGSMTYAGLKSMVYAGLNENDPRVKAALKWLSKNYSVKEHPGQGDAGLYYYYHTFASALKAAKLDSLEGPNGDEHNWRVDLTRELASRQNDNGSWTNDNNRWLEDNADLSTAFALLALAYCA